MDVHGPWPLLTVVSGAPGAGKTSFVERALAETPHIWLTLRRHRHANELAARLDRRLRAALATLPPELATAAGPSCGPAADADPLGRAEQLGALIGEALDLTLRRDLVLVLDEVERIDHEPGPTRLIESLVRSAPGGLSVVLVTRTDAPFPIDRMRREGELRELGPADLALTDDDATALVATHWPAAETSEIEAVVDLGNGNPALLSDVARLLRRAHPADTPRLLEHCRTAADPLGEVGRLAIDRLEPPTRELLDDLLILGDASIPELTTIDGPRVADHVADLIDAGVAEHQSGAGGRVAPTRRVQEAVTPSADRARRRSPEAVALATGRGDGRRALSIAVRYGDADLIATTTAELASSVIDDGDAQLVLDAIDALPSDRVEAVRGLAGRAAQALGDWRLAVAEYERAATSGVGAADAWRHGLIQYLQGDVAAARSIYQRGLDQPADADSTADRAMLAGYAGAAAWMTGDLDAARELSAEALTLSTRAGDDRALAVAHTTAALVAASDGDRVSNDWYYVRALQHAERAGDALQIARIRTNRGSRLLEEGEFEASLAELDLAVRHADLGGYGAVLALALSNRGEVATKVGRLDEARTDLSAAVDLLQRQGSRFVAYPLTVLARLFVIRGDIEQARGAGERSLALAEVSVDQQAAIAARVQLARSLADRDPDLAWQHATDATKGAGSLDLAEAWSVVATLALDRGDATGAAGAARRASELARSTRDRWALAQALEVDALVEQDLRLRRLRLEESHALFQELGCAIDAARLDLRLAELDPTEASVPRLVAVADLARRLGARPLAAAADDLLAIRRADERHDLAVTALGSFALTRRGTPVPTTAWQSKRARDLFKMLVSLRGRPLPRERAIERLWPGDDPAKTANKLSVALATVRSVLDPDKEYDSDRYVRADGESIRLDTAAVAVDVERFLAAADAAMNEYRRGNPHTATTMLAAVEASYVGDLFEEDPYSDWHVPLRETARSTYLTVAKALAERRTAEGDVDDAIRLLLRVLEREPFDEPAHLELVGLLSRAGRHGDARRRYQYYADRMRELDLEPHSFPAGGAPRQPGQA